MGLTRYNVASTATPAEFLRYEGANMLSGFHVLWTPETRPVIGPGKWVACRMYGTAGSTITMGGFITFESIQ
jgi:hypothetical protein